MIQINFGSHSGGSTKQTYLLECCIQAMVELQSLQNGHSYYSQFFELEKNLLSDSLSLLQADFMAIQNLNLIKQSSEGVMRVYAKNLFTGIQGFSDYSEPYQLPQPGLYTSKVRWQSPQPIKKDSLKIYPNPAQNYAIVEFFLKDDNSRCLLRIYDYSGKLFNELPLNGAHGYLNLTLGEYPSGIYICSMECENAILESVRLIIVR